MEEKIPLKNTTTEEKAICPVCPHHCRLAEGAVGLCRARMACRGADGALAVAAQNYGRLTSVALDPIEKKPLARFRPGSMVLSVGSYGCNLRCPFCQNHDIAQCGSDIPWESWTPEALARQALELAPRGNIGLAFTYNEPAVGWEFVRDAACCAKALGLTNVMVTNGYFCDAVLDELLPLVDAFNIDLKCFTPQGYQKLGGGPDGLETVKGTIAKAARHAHVEVTTLVVPGLSDDEDGMEREAAWLAGISPAIPLHISRYFPRWQADEPATPPAKLRALEQIAKRHLAHVYLGNI